MKKTTTVAWCAVVITMLGANTRAQEGEPVPEWHRFRSAHPYHVQALALGEPRTDGRRVLVIAEPPPHMTQPRLSELLPAAASLDFPQHPVGYDGWVRDAVAILPRLSDSALQELIDTLHGELFFTSYKGYVIRIGHEPSPERVDPASLNLDVTAAELEQWLLPNQPPGVSATAILVWMFTGVMVVIYAGRLRRKQASAGIMILLLAGLGASVAVRPDTPSDPSARFSRIGAAESLSGRDILDRAVGGVFVSRDPGLVLCALSTHVPLADVREDLRRFAVDADLILGAVKQGDQVIIVGRERVAPVSVLPPLRVETLLQLAAVGEDELAQSYERRNIVSGRFDEKRDWAPIYLSATLLDTEYGSLLNITDQLLKSWSLRGLVKYHNFAYPAPASYPFDVPLPEHARTNQVTFNWNTKGAGYVVESGGTEILALNRTGALPVDYLAGEDSRLSDAEETAYEYFTGTGDPNLVRVVQYAALYQIFRRFGISTPPSRPLPPVVTPAVARNTAAFVVRQMARLDITRFDDLVRRASTDGADDAVAQFTRLRQVKTAVDELQRRGGDAAMTRLADALAAPREFRADGEMDEHVRATAYGWMGEQLQQLLDLPLDLVLMRYVLESARPEDGWIRTPSVVISWSETPDGRSGTWIGGHNLSARTSSLQADETVSPGSVRLIETDGHRVLAYHPDDASRVARVVRPLGRGQEKDAGRLANELEQVLRTSTSTSRSMVDAVAFKAPADAVRGLSPAHVPGSMKELGWRSADHPPTPQQVEITASVSQGGAPAYVLERNDAGAFALYGAHERPVLLAGSAVSAFDALTNVMRSTEAGSAVRLHMRGLEAHQAKGFLQSVELRLPERLRNRIAGTLDDGRMPPRDLKRILANDYEFSRARIERVSNPVLTPRGTQVDVHLQVPGRSTRAGSLAVRIRLLFKAALEVTEQTVSAIRSQISSWVAALKPGISPADLAVAVKGLEADLRRAHPHLTGVDMMLSREGQDIIITEHRPASGQRALHEAA